AFSSTNILVGGTIMERWDGQRWQNIPLPNKYSISNLSAASPQSIWAIGTVGKTLTVGATLPVLQIEHWDEQQWHQLPLADWMRSNILIGKPSIQAVSEDNVWVPWSGRQPALAHWNGKSWEKIDLPLASSQSSMGYIGALAILGK